MSGRELSRWSERGLNGLPAPVAVDGVRLFSLKAPNEDLAAQALICFVTWHCETMNGVSTNGRLRDVLERSFGPTVRCAPTSLVALFCANRLITVFVEFRF